MTLLDACIVSSSDCDARGYAEPQSDPEAGLRAVEGVIERGQDPLTTVHSPSATGVQTAMPELVALRPLDAGQDVPRVLSMAGGGCPQCAE